MAESACASIPCYLCVAVALAVSKVLTQEHRGGGAGGGLIA
jgi:hypothetical protein